MKNGNGTTKPAQDPGKLRRVVVGATVGTAVEYYDFIIYAMASALVFGDCSSPRHDPLRARFSPS